MQAAKRMAGCSALGKRMEQQPGARLTMARFTAPSWHMAANKSSLRDNAVFKRSLDLTSLVTEFHELPDLLPCFC